jgi:hypothetical protein
MSALKAHNKIAQGKRALRAPPWDQNQTNHSSPEGAAET